MVEKNYREKVEKAAATKQDRRMKKDIKGGKLNWSGYLEMSDHPKIRHGTEAAKTVLEEMMPQFLAGLDERIEGEWEWWTGQGASYPPAGADDRTWRYLSAAYYFFKWLGQMPIFDPANDPGRPIPIVALWVNAEGKLGFVHNFIGTHFDNMISVTTVMHPMNQYIAEFFEKEKKKVNRWRRKKAGQAKTGNDI